MSNYQTESHYRSVLKGITWRIMGTIDTILISFIISGKLQTAFKIGFTEVITKIALYYIHERVWIYYLKQSPQTKAISLYKAISWRIIGTVDTIILAWFYTGNALSGLKIGLTEVLTKIILFYIHERLWHKVPIGTVRQWFKLKE